ncbi:hypothetical protein, partial [Amycolatopsis sp. NPDC059020]|uniref:hypothetical protein n=1 Tax=Amycolatopsis sp. NPDC059020 TaxID=3346703 RepID=UPI0036711F91
MHRFPGGRGGGSTGRSGEAEYQENQHTQKKSFSFPSEYSSHQDSPWDVANAPFGTFIVGNGAFATSGDAFELGG